jgi:hypothetical protein
VYINRKLNFFPEAMLSSSLSQVMFLVQSICVCFPFYPQGNDVLETHGLVPPTLTIVPNMLLQSRQQLMKALQKAEAEVTQSVPSDNTLYDCGSISGRSGFDPRQVQRICPLASVSRPALGLTQPLVQWVLEVLSPELKRGRVVTLTTHPIYCRGQE